MSKTRWIRTVAAALLVLFVILTSPWQWLGITWAVIVLLIAVGAIRRRRRTRAVVLVAVIAAGAFSAPERADADQVGTPGNCYVEAMGWGNGWLESNVYTMESQPFGTDLARMYQDAYFCYAVKSGTLTTPKGTRLWITGHRKWMTITRSGETAGWEGGLLARETFEKCLSGIVSGPARVCFKAVWVATWKLQRTGGAQLPIGGADTEYVRIRTTCNAWVQCDSKADQDSILSELDPHRAPHRLRSR